MERMVNLVDNIFEHYEYELVEFQNEDNIKVYKLKDHKRANYFMTYFIDCRNINNDYKQIQNLLNTLEQKYKGNNYNKEEKVSLKLKIMNSLESEQEKSQIDKNMSAIYIMLLDNIEETNELKNIIYNIEESANYFKRYVLPYTKDQLEAVEEYIEMNVNNDIEESLNELVNNDDEYQKLMRNNSLKEKYAFVVRLFSKIPFLKYRFKDKNQIGNLKSDIQKKMDSKLVPLNELLDDKDFNFERLWDDEKNRKKFKKMFDLVEDIPEEKLEELLEKKLKE